MAARSASIKIFLGLLLSTVFHSLAGGQSASTSANEAWPEADAHAELPSNWRLLSFAGLERAVGYPFTQWYVATGIGRRFKPILREHWRNIDPDKEHFLVLGAGYEYLRTADSGRESHENRVTFNMTPNFRPTARLLLRDRN
jgi:hypothetical protein